WAAPRPASSGCPSMVRAARTPELEGRSLRQLLVRRLISLVFVLFGMSLMTFTISHLIPADPAAAAAGIHGTELEIQTIRERMGLDLPLHEQYLRYMGRLLQGDLGHSIRNNIPVRDELLEK